MVPAAGAALAHLAYARICEHGLKDLPLALYHARRCAGAEGPEAHLRRLARLEKKVAAPAMQQGRRYR